MHAGARCGNLGYRARARAFSAAPPPDAQIMAREIGDSSARPQRLEKISRKLSSFDALEAEGRNPIEGGYRLSVIRGDRPTADSARRLQLLQHEAL